jgi:hypothetical protein
MAIRLRALASAIVGFIGTGVYIAVIAGEGEPQLVPLIAWASVMAGASFVALAGSLVTRESLARRLLVVSAVLFGILGFLALFSIGLVFVIAAVLSVWAATTVRTVQT